MEAIFGGLEGELGSNFLAAVGGFPQFALNCGDETDEVLFGDVILGTGAHGFDGGGFGHDAGEHDEGDIEGAGAQDLQGRGTAELGQIVVGEDEIGQGSGERLDHLGGSLDTLNRRDEPVLPQMAFQQESVVGIVFDEEDSQGTRRRSAPRTYGRT